MKIYLHSESAEKSAQYPLIVSPAGDQEFVTAEDAKNKGWFNAKGDAIQYQVDFVYGVAEVETSLGRYMVDRGLAHKSRIIRRVSQLFDAAGNAIGAVFDRHGQRVLLEGDFA